MTWPWSRVQAQTPQIASNMKSADPRQANPLPWPDFDSFEQAPASSLKPESETEPVASAASESRESKADARRAFVPSSTG